MAWKNDQVGAVETAKILAVARECLRVPGDFVELGCYKGDTALKVAEILRGSGKNLWLYDSFEGLPEKTAEDQSAVGEEFVKGALAVTKREVKARFLRSGLAVPKIKKAWFGDLTVADMPAEIAFAFIDGDLYRSIGDGLRLVENLMVPGGVILVHDYEVPALPGVTQAVEEWLREHPEAKMTKYQSLAVIMI